MSRQADLPFPKQSNTDPLSLLWPRSMCVQTAARYLDATPWFVEGLCRSGKIAAFKLGKKWAIDRMELDRFVEGQTSDAKKQLIRGARSEAA